jgi:hypothetical protein
MFSFQKRKKLPPGKREFFLKGSCFVKDDLMGKDVIRRGIPYYASKYIGQI